MGAAMSEYRKKAEECLRAAERMRDPADRIEMLFIARGYMSLADHADRCQSTRSSKMVPAIADGVKGPDQRTVMGKRPIGAKCSAKLAHVMRSALPGH